MKEQGEGVEDEFGWQRAQAEGASHSCRNIAQVGSVLICFHKPPGLSKSISLFSFKWRWGLVSNLINHPLPSKWDSGPLGVRETASAFHGQSISSHSTFLFSWPRQQMASLSKDFNLISLQAWNTHTKLTVWLPYLKSLGHRLSATPASASQINFNLHEPK